jgi:hypothetical protein
MARRTGLYSNGVAAVLKSRGVVAATKAAAEAIAQNVRDMKITVGDKDGGKHEYPLPVTVKMVTTDRAHAIVALAHPAGEAVQAKHGALTKAAAQAGLSVRERKS